ncbi:MAG: SMP-30/gluconolactonase/LRE family protein [Acidobacteriota bacterium]
MRRQTPALTVAAVCLAAWGAAAQSLTLTRTTLSLDAARAAIAAAEQEAARRGLGVVTVVVDDAGNLIQLSRMDAAQVASVNVGIGKARTAAIYRRPSRVFEEQVRNGRIAALALADATPLQGGVPVTLNGRVIGAVGVSGDTPQVDEEIAMAGVRAVEAAIGGTRRDVPYIERLDPRLDAVLDAAARIERLADGFEWVEGPLWDAANGRLLFSDVPRNEVLAWDAAHGARTFLARSGYTGTAPFAGREPGSNGLAWDAQGRLVLCQHGDRRIARLDADGRLTVLADRYQGQRLNSPNDLVVRANGDIYFTDPPFGLPGTYDDAGKELPFQGVFRLAGNGPLQPVVTELRAPNGLAFSPDGSTLYVSNADRQHPVWMAYPVRDDGTMGGGRVFARVEGPLAAGDGAPDGMKVDRAGNLFATGPGGVHIFAPDGTRLGRIVTGVPTGNVAWGPDGALFIAANHALLRVQTRTTGAPR